MCISSHINEVFTILHEKARLNVSKRKSPKIQMWYDEGHDHDLQNFKRNLSSLEPTVQGSVLIKTEKKDSSTLKWNYR